MGWKEDGNRWRAFNPFQEIEGDEQALGAAKSSAYVSGYLVFSYAVQAGIVYWTGQDTFGNRGIVALVADIVFLLLAAFLTWRIWKRQPVWACTLVALWYGFELVFKIMAMVSGRQIAGVFWIFMFVALASAAIIGVRGSWKLRRIRRTAPDAAVASVFGPR